MILAHTYKILALPFIVLAAVCLTAPGIAKPAADLPRVTTSSGMLQGKIEQRSKAFLAIPYAAPPIGKLRWKAPQPTGRWKGVRDATQFAASCYQSPPQSFGPFTSEFLISPPSSEDCLYLNVWTPTKAQKEKLPVMVYIPGGGFSSGSGSVPIYNGAALAARGVMVVNVNYRLGVFGFLAHRELTSESRLGTSGTYGIEDVIAALKWLRRNAAAFGGDPQNVTIVGQSAGATIVNALMMSPSAKGLFHKAITHSGSGFGRTWRTLEQSEQIGDIFLEAAGAANLSALRAMSADKLWNVPVPPDAKLTGTTPGRGWYFHPPVDGKIWTAQSADSLAPVASPVPLISGFMANELGSLDGRIVATSPAEFEALVRSRFANGAQELLALYPHATEAEVAASTPQFLTDTAVAGLIMWAAGRKARGQTVYPYIFNHALPGSQSSRFGAFHTADIPYLFGVFDIPDRTFTAEDHTVSLTLQSYWINFMRSGNPNGAGLPVFHAVMSAADGTTTIGDGTGRVVRISTTERAQAFRAAFEEQGYTVP